MNSENNGPYGDAIMQELLPAIETTFRVIRQPWARMLSGGSTGGWIAAAHQVFYPDFYGGAFASCPDSVDFNYHQIVNIYKDANAYYLEQGWMKVDRPTQRRPDGNIVSMMKDENHYELVVGDKSRSGGQWDIWEATFSPVGKDGYPMRLWDKETGVIDKAVAERWKKYDLLDVVKTNWATLGPKIGHKLNMYVGDMDSYYLNDAVENFNAFWQKAGNPGEMGEIVFQRRAPHCWGPSAPELLDKMTKQIDRYAPAGADKTSWRYRAGDHRPAIHDRRRQPPRTAGTAALSARGAGHAAPAASVRGDSRIQRGSRAAADEPGAGSGARCAERGLVGPLRERRQPRPNGARAGTAASRRSALRLRAAVAQLRPPGRAQRRPRPRPGRRRHHHGRRSAASARDAPGTRRCLAAGIRRGATRKVSTVGLSGWRRRVTPVAYSFIKRVAGIRIIPQASDYRLMDAGALDALRSLPEVAKLYRGLTSWVGFRQCVIPYVTAGRAVESPTIRCGSS